MYNTNNPLTAFQIQDSLYAKTYQRTHAGLPFAEIHNVLHIFITGLNGRTLKLANSEVTFTDTETLFLPTTLNHFVQRQDNFFLYKAISVHLWAQTWFGTWQQRLSTKITLFSHRDKALRLFHTLERLRLDACIARELPGMSRDMKHLLTLFSEKSIPVGWEEIARHLAQPTATVNESYQLLETVYHWKVPPPVCYQGILLPEQVEQTIAQRRKRDKKAFQTELSQLLEEKKLSKSSTENASNPNPASPSALNSQTYPQSSNPPSAPQKSGEDGNVGIEREKLEEIAFSSTIPILTMDGQPILPSENLKKIIASIVQDNGTIPKDYLSFPNPGENVEAKNTHQNIESPNNETQLAENAEKTEFFYSEWDYRREQYYKNWCVLREVAVPLKSEQFVTDTLQRYRRLLKTLRRTFELLRGDNQHLKKQPFGEDIDIDALVETYADAKNGLEMSQQIFTKIHKMARNIAVMFMVDMSGSTQGWINQAERESLVLLCEVLETLGDRYAIYGFSGMTRKRCDIYPIKRFDESYNTLVRQRISGIAPQEYTRMGVTIRHLTQLLKKMDAQIKLLITLSDGKPDDDGDNYRGIYGIEDTRQALLEAKREGIHPFCITIDTDAKSYLPRMYGAVNYTVIEKVQQLPLKISDIYRKITT
jgi:nitric oxide reductase NorD protein